MVFGPNNVYFGPIPILEVRIRIPYNLQTGSSMMAGSTDVFS